MVFVAKEPETVMDEDDDGGDTAGLAAPMVHLLELQVWNADTRKILFKHRLLEPCIPEATLRDVYKKIKANNSSLDWAPLVKVHSSTQRTSVITRTRHGQVERSDGHEHDNTVA